VIKMHINKHRWVHNTNKTRSSKLNTSEDNLTKHSCINDWQIRHWKLPKVAEKHKHANMLPITSWKLTMSCPYDVMVLIASRILPTSNWNKTTQPHFSYTLQKSVTFLTFIYQNKSVLNVIIGKNQTNWRVQLRYHCTMS
jgi:hypothetical protein